MRYQQAAFDYVDKLDRLESPEQVMTSLVHIFSLGFDTVLFSGLNPGRRFDESVLAHQWPPEFFRNYTQRHYIRFDPVARLARSAMTPFFWRASSWAHSPDTMAREVMDYAAEFGICQGLNVPVRGPNGLEAAVSLSGRKIDADPRCTRAYHLMCLYAFVHLQSLIETRADQSSDLTEREREVLAWSAQGQSAQETAQLLHIAKRTVDEHVRNCCRKLQAHNRTHAVAIALRDRLIEL